jgi:protein involved in sex pheromone biosynthesis
MDFLKNNIFNQIGNMLKDVTTNLVGQALDVTSNLQKAMINAPAGFMGKTENLKKKEMITEEIIKNLEKNREENEESAMKFFTSNVVHIEIVREDGQLEKAFFPILPFCHSLKMVRNLFDFRYDILGLILG